jgi:PiT family inorganic phosphate transporter
MDIAVLIFLTSGLFLGWSLGANDAANVFGTAVGTRMIRFSTAAAICGIFVILGAVISGAGAAHTLGKLGSVNALSGSFMAAFSAGLAVYVMTKFGLPVSTTQAIVGSIIGWSLFSETLTDTNAMTKILITWVVCPMLAAVIAILLFKLVTQVLRYTNLHILRTDAYTRLGLVVAGAFGAYSLGANNIANVMGVFISSSPFTDFSLAGFVNFSSVQQLFLLGGLAIAIGVVTYSKRVMLTVGGGLLPLSPVAAWVVVMAHSIVLFLFASQGLERLLAGYGLPTIPLVPVSSSQAVVGAVLGIGLLKGGRGLRPRVLVGIGAGWVLTPIIAGVVCIIGLFVMQNVFNQQVYRPVAYEISQPVIDRLARAGIAPGAISGLEGKRFASAVRFDRALDVKAGLGPEDKAKLLVYAELDEMTVAPERLGLVETGWLTIGQTSALRRLLGRTFSHKWMFAEALIGESAGWKPLADSKVNKAYNKELRDKLDFLYRNFRTDR